MGERIVVPEKAALRVLAAVEAVKQAQANVQATVQLVADALDVPEGWTIAGDAEGLYFAPAAMADEAREETGAEEG